jgi:multidrug resistance efflux pump
MEALRRSFRQLLITRLDYASVWRSAMPAEQRKAPDDEIELTEPSALDGLSAAELANAPVADRLAGLDARAQSALLREAFEKAEPPELDTIPPAPLPKRNGILNQLGWRAFKSALGLAIVVIAGVGPVQRLLELSSVEAVVNARLVSLRAPIEGRIESTDLAPTIGEAAPKGRPMLRISNSRADRARLDDLQRLVDQAETERPVIARRLMRLKEIYEQISQQAHAFQAGRIRELEARVLDLKAQASASEASGSEAASTLARTQALAASGHQTSVAVERAERDAKVASQTQKSLNHRLFAVEVELEAARRGEYVGDSYNDRPSSLQHADELSIRVAETESELTAHDQRLARLHSALDKEVSRYSELSSVVLASPADASVWEVLVTPGEEVRKGQDLMRLLDCSGPIVSVTVRESVFNQLQIGDNAQFHFSGQSKRYNGTIIRMSGSAAPSENLAIQATGSASGGYRIAVSVPELAATQCSVGRSGTVVFHPSAAKGTLQSLREAISFFLPS